MWGLMVRDGASHLLTTRVFFLPRPEERAIARVSKDEAMIAVRLFF
jgi:hypothetical protein